MRFPFDTVIERDGDEIEVRVIYDVSPVIPATGPTYDCGGQPAEGGEVEIISATFVGVDAANMPSPLTDAEEDALLQEAIARSGDDMAEEAAAQADWRYQEYRDRQLMDRWERGQ